MRFAFLSKGCYFKNRDVNNCKEIPLYQLEAADYGTNRVLRLILEQKLLI